jgi:5-formyltetrahydrofolate cyclo-ligase
MPLLWRLLRAPAPMSMAYLVNVTVRPGSNLANAGQALSYGHGYCDKVFQGRTYAQVMAT